MTFEEFWAANHTDVINWTSVKYEDIAHKAWEASHLNVIGKLAQPALIDYLNREYINVPNGQRPAP